MDEDLLGKKVKSLTVRMTEDEYNFLEMLSQTQKVFSKGSIARQIINSWRLIMTSPLIKILKSVPEIIAAMQAETPNGNGEIKAPSSEAPSTESHATPSPTHLPSSPHTACQTQASSTEDLG